MSLLSNEVIIDLYPTVQALQQKIKDYLYRVNIILKGIPWMISDLQGLINTGVIFKFDSPNNVLASQQETLKEAAKMIQDTFTRYGGLVVGENDDLKDTGVFTNFLKLDQNFSTTDVIIAIDNIIYAYTGKDVYDFIMGCNAYFGYIKIFLYAVLINVETTINKNDAEQMKYFNAININCTYYSRIPFVMNNIGFSLLSFLKYINK